MAKPKLRKMLGDIQSAEAVQLMRLIETQSKQTLAAWAANYVEAHALPLLQKHGCTDPRPTAAIAAVKAHLRGDLTIKELRPILTAARAAGAELSADPIVQAAARAIGTGCATILTPTNAFGFTMYSAAATAYDTAGLTADAAAYNALAQQELGRALESLRAVAVENEANPVKADWGC